MERLVILDGYPVNAGEFDWNTFSDCFENIDRYDRTSEEEILDRIKDATHVLTCKVPLRKEVLEKCKNLKYVGSMATGINHIDVDFCTQNNITVTNVPDYSTDAVSELVFAYIFDYYRKVSIHNRRVHAGDWTRAKDFCFYDRRVSEIAGKTIGIFGYGNIGKKVAKIADAFGMNVLVYTRTKRENTESIKFVSKEELFQNSDIITLHCPLTDETNQIINKATLETMKDGVILINTARGQLVNEEDLKNSLQNGKVGIAYLDVVSNEPMREDNVLLGVQNCVITPHYGWCPIETRERLFNQLKENIAGFQKGIPCNVVNQ